MAKLGRIMMVITDIDDDDVNDGDNDDDDGDDHDHERFYQVNLFYILS